MEIEYGPVLLKALDLSRFERRAVYTPDGADLLYVRNVIGASCTYSPGGIPRMPSVTSQTDSAVRMAEGLDNTLSVLNSNPRGVPDTGRGSAVSTSLASVPALESDIGGAHRLDSSQFHTGPQTDMELRNILLTPRQRLTLWAYGMDGTKMRWLESPRPGFVTDATVGPMPLSCDVVNISGEPRTIGVFFQIQTDVSPCPTGSDRLVLSHRWQMMHTHDANYYLTRIIRGEIVFNGAYITAFGINPDSVRNQFIHPIPIGYTRGLPEITQSPDGLTIRYTITDTDPTIMFCPGDSGATQMQILERMTLVKPWSNWSL